MLLPLYDAAKPYRSVSRRCQTKISLVVWFAIVPLPTALADEGTDVIISDVVLPLVPDCKRVEVKRDL